MATKKKAATTQDTIEPTEGCLDVMLILLDPSAAEGERFKGLGTHEFRVLPRIGETVTIDVEEGGDFVGYAFEVVGVYHPDTPQACAADVYIVRRGMISDELGKMLKRCAPPA